MDEVKQALPKVKIFPGRDFWAQFVRKLLSFFVSFKVIVVALASVLMYYRIIGDTAWATVVVSVTLGRVVVQTLSGRVNDDNLEVGENVEPRGE